MSRLPALVLSVLLALVLAPPGAQARSLARPDFRLPFQCAVKAALTTYVGHNPDDKKIDMFPVGGEGTPVVASADGYIHEWFNPGGLEIRHGGGWFTVYLHMTGRRGIGEVKRGDVIGYVGGVGGVDPHLHYEQLYNPNSSANGDTQHMVHSVIQGQLLVMDPNRPVSITSTNCGGGTTPPDGPPKYYVDIFANAPGYSSPGGTRTGTLYAGTAYVYCRVWGPEVRVGSAYNHWWLKTDLDQGDPWRDQYVSAYYLTRWGNDQAKDNSGADIPNC